MKSLGVFGDCSGGRDAEGVADAAAGVEESEGGKAVMVGTGTTAAEGKDGGEETPLGPGIKPTVEGGRAINVGVGGLARSRPSSDK